MPLQNRVDPFSKILAVPERGKFMGNRGVLHNQHQDLVTDRWKTQLWIICDTRVRPGWARRQLMTPRRYTELFFLDEATAFAAGHRPCAECRYQAWKHYGQALCQAEGHQNAPKAPQINQRLHGEMRLYLRKTNPQKRPWVSLASLPDGAMFAHTDQAYLKWQNAAYPWSFAGYGPACELPKQGFRLTPELNCLALHGGYNLQIDNSINQPVV